MGSSGFSSLECAFQTFTGPMSERAIVSFLFRLCIVLLEYEFLIHSLCLAPIGQFLCENNLDICTLSAETSVSIVCANVRRCKPGCLTLLSAYPTLKQCPIAECVATPPLDFEH